MVFLFAADLGWGDLSGAGYTTAPFGKWHLGHVSPADYGVDVFRTDRFENTDRPGPVDIWGPQARPRCSAEILDDTPAGARTQTRSGTMKGAR